MSRIAAMMIAVMALFSSTTQAADIWNADFVPAMTFEQTMNLIRSIHAGMSLTDATKLLEDAGLRKLGIEVGDSFFWSAFFRLSEGYQLTLDCETMNGVPDLGHTNGIVRSAWIETVDKHTLIFRLSESNTLNRAISAQKKK